ncbi:hypothetical protein HF521_002896 [Silurus meridionalis]|uniref:Uncharacterized protein n=1 Tax=Silurus meridionalis TaxID=175797 RepID=A0A8T0B2G2_SILME|nr:hypothetical protein HF521_002896 [Silurus meridionalis]
MGIFGPYQLRSPGSVVVSAKDAKGCLQVLVQPFSLPVGLRVEPGGQADRDTQEAAELLPKIGSGLRTPIRDDDTRETMKPNTCCSRSWAVSLAEGSLGSGMK